VAAKVQPFSQGDSAGDLEKQKIRLRENCDEFESVMIAYMMKTMRDSTMRAEEPGAAMGVFEDMLTGQVSKAVSHNSSLGLGDLLYSKLEPLVKPQVHKEADLAAAQSQAAASVKQVETSRGD
jgi:Rod binding domain-containing protein